MRLVKVGVALLGCALASGAPAVGEEFQTPEICKAVSAKDASLERVKQLVSSGADVESKCDKGGSTPLQWAASRDNLEVVKFLLSRHANLEARDEYGRTPLASAVGSDKVAMVRLLLDKHANALVLSEDGKTLLIEAAMSGTAEMIQILADKKINVDARGGSFIQGTALSEAAEWGNVAAIGALLDRRANIELRDSRGWSPLEWAAKSEHVEGVRLLLDRGAKVDARNPDGVTPLMRAAENGRTANVQLLLERGAAVNARDTRGRSALYQAVQYDKIDAARVLLDRGASVNERDAKGDPILFHTHKLELLRLLLDRGADVRARNNKQATALSGANSAEEAALLLDRGAEINAAREEGSTALVDAILMDHAEVVKLLVDRGANLETHSQPVGFTPLMHAATSFDGKKAVQYIQWMADKGVDLNARGKSGYTALHWAVSWDRAEAIGALLDRGADIEARMDFDLTPLIYAARDNRPKVVKLLVDRGASLKAKTSYGATALDAAQSSKYKECIDILQAAQTERELLEQSAKLPAGEQYAAYLAAFQKTPANDNLRVKVIELSLKLPRKPEVTEEARQLFALATAKAKTADTPAAMAEPIGLLRKATEYAPCWANAYYNLSRLLEVSGQFDDAMRQLNFYLKLNPAENDAREARAHLAVIQAQKELAQQKKQ